MDRATRKASIASLPASAQRRQHGVGLGGSQSATVKAILKQAVHDGLLEVEFASCDVKQPVSWAVNSLRCSHVSLAVNPAEAGISPTRC